MGADREQERFAAELVCPKSCDFGYLVDRADFFLSAFICAIRG